MTQKIKTECCEKCKYPENKELASIVFHHNDNCPCHTPAKECNYMQVGRIIACGHCDKRFEPGLRQAIQMGITECKCICHDKVDQECKTSPNCSHNTNGRDMNKPCSVEFNPKEVNTLQGDSWKKEFNDRFCETTFGSEEKTIPHYYLKYSTDDKQIKEFIRSLLLQEKARVVSLCEKMKEDIGPFEVGSEFATPRDNKKQGRCQVLEELLEILKSI